VRVFFYSACLFYFSCIYFCYPRQGGYVFALFVLFVCLFVGGIKRKKTQPIFTKFGGKLARGPRITRSSHYIRVRVQSGLQLTFYVIPVRAMLPVCLIRYFFNSNYQSGLWTVVKVRGPEGAQPPAPICKCVPIRIRCPWYGNQL